jgi:hypothetical protein
MSNKVPQILIKFRNRSRKNHQISTQINSVLQKALCDFQSALPEFCDPDLDPYLSMCLEDAWEKLSSICDTFDVATDNRKSDYLGFEQMVNAYQEN